MTKQRFDFLFIILLLVFLAVARPFLFDLHLINILYGFFWLIFPKNFLLNFLLPLFPSPLSLTYALGYSNGLIILLQQESLVFLPYPLHYFINTKKRLILLKVPFLNYFKKDCRLFIFFHLV